MLYVPDDADFNEAFATTVEEEGVRRWLKAQGRERDLAEFALQQRHYQEVVALMSRTRDDLRALYALGNRARAHAGAQTNGLCRAARFLCAAQGRMGPDMRRSNHWFEEAQLNNAHLASVATYFDCVPGFEHELDSAGANLEAFYRRVRELAKLDQARRDALLCGQRYQARIAPPAGDAGS